MTTPEYKMWHAIVLQMYPDALIGPDRSGESETGTIIAVKREADFENINCDSYGYFNPRMQIAEIYRDGEEFIEMELP